MCRHSSSSGGLSPPSETTCAAFPGWCRDCPSAGCTWRSTETRGTSKLKRCHVCRTSVCVVFHLLFLCPLCKGIRHGRDGRLDLAVSGRSMWRRSLAICPPLRPFIWCWNTSIRPLQRARPRVVNGPRNQVRTNSAAVSRHSCVRHHCARLPVSLLVTPR